MKFGRKRKIWKTRNYYFLGATDCFEILITAYLLRENPADFFSTFDDVPRIICTSASYNPENFATILEEDSSFDIMVEDDILTSSSNFFEAFSLMLAMYYFY